MCLVLALPSNPSCKYYSQPTAKEPGKILGMQMLLHPSRKSSQAFGVRVVLHCLLDLPLIAEQRRQECTEKTLFPRCSELEIQGDGNHIGICYFMPCVTQLSFA